LLHPALAYQIVGGECTPSSVQVNHCLEMAEHQEKNAVTCQKLAEKQQVAGWMVSGTP